MGEYFELLKIWCDGMIDRQITQLKDDGIYGGLMCPACSFIHGRCYEAIHPMLYLAEKTGEEKYIDSARQMIKWSAHMACPDGSFINDSANGWKGITVFSSAALTKAMYKYGSLLDTESLQLLEQSVASCLDFIYNKFDPYKTNINYLAGAAFALELGGKYTGNAKYKEKAALYARDILNYITPSGLICGEGAKPWNTRSPKGCYGVDIGYNIEETLDLMALYADSAGDSEVLAKTVEAAKAHGNFALPDGGWDNSFGTRMDKWTYWGSRTSDGCLPAYTILSKFDESFDKIASANFRYLKSCTHGGLLHGGRDLNIQGEPACIHHTFAHAEGLTVTLEWLEEKGQQQELSKIPPAPVSKYYPELDTFIHRDKQWRATVTGYDSGMKMLCHPSGGALSLLYHNTAGLILTSSMSRFTRYEMVNTQRHLHDEDTPLTMRIQLGGGQLEYANILDKSAVIKSEGNTYSVSGKLTDDEGNSPPCGDIFVKTSYNFEGETAYIKFEHSSESEALDIIIPAVCAAGEDASLKNNACIIKREGCEITISSSSPMDLAQGRLFNHVPGMQALPLRIKNAGQYTEIRIAVK